MNILSLFDGMSCGQIALNKLGLKDYKYYASEVDEHAIKVTQHNYPNTIQLGDVRNVHYKDGILYTDNNEYNVGEIDLLMGGSPCQSFSFAGKRVGMATSTNEEILTLDRYLESKESGFEFVGQSYLFWEYVRLLREINPKHFLLENVRMANKWKSVISNTLDIEPIEINSSLVSAQDRKRLYWTNIKNVEQPDNKHIYLDNILDNDVDDKLFLKEELYDRYEPNNKPIDREKSSVIGKLSPYQGDRVFSAICKCSSLSASGGNNGGGGCNIIHSPKDNRLRRLSVNECEKAQTVPTNYTCVVSETQRYRMLGNGWTVDVIKHILKNIIQ